MDSVIDKEDPFEFMDVTQEKLQIDLIELCNKDMQHKTKEKNILMCKMRIGDMMHEQHLLFMNNVAFQTCHFTLDVYNFQACLPKFFTTKKLETIFLYMKKDVC